MNTLKINDLYASVEDKLILKGCSLEVKENEIHALMGPNGNGKSTLLSVIMGNPKFNVQSGSITLNSQDVLSMKVDERSKAGLFLGMQYPSEISGVTNSDFLRAAINARRERPIPLFSFIREMEGAIKELQMKDDLAHRFVNEGFSGGEKKRNEIIQLKMLKPNIALLDEIDSRLDVDALKLVAQTILDVQKQTGMGIIVVSHYARFLQLLQPTHAHVLMDGQIVLSGDASLVEKVDQEGYDWIENEYGVSASKEDPKPRVVLGSCAVNKGGH